jgi:hypothetical protein
MSRVARRLPLVAALAVVTAGANCSGQYLITSAENYYTYECPFTDAAAAQVRKDADELCRKRGRVTVLVSDVCDMTRCFTNFQCVSHSEAPQILR